MPHSVHKRKLCRSLTVSCLIIGLLIFVILVPLIINICPIENTSKSYPIGGEKSPIAQNSDGYKDGLSCSNNGESLDCTIHQSKLELGNSLYEISDASNPENNTFSIVSPDDRNFSETYQEIMIADLYSPNVSVIYEDDASLAEFSLDVTSASSFRIKSSGYLENISVYLSNDADGNKGNLTLQIYNSTWNDINEIAYHEPDNQYKMLGSGIEIENGFNDWYLFSNLNTYLDTSKTINETFFIVLNDTNDNTIWYDIHDRSPGSTDNSNDLDCLKEVSQNSWELLTFSPGDLTKSIDFTLKVDFRPVNHHPNVSEINLEINNKVVLDLGEGQGTWNNTEIFDMLPDSINFTITSTAWWDVSCNITKILVNYTRTDLEATASYFFDENDQAVQWNATLGSFNGFDSDFGNYWINFTVPKSWENITVYNASELILENPSLGAARNGYRELQIYPASNGSNWYITAEEDRLKSNVIVLFKPEKITPGEHFRLKFNATLLNGSKIIPFQGVEITVDLYVNGEFLEDLQNSTDYRGIVTFRIIIPNYADSMYLNVDLPGTLNYTSTSFQINDIIVSSPPDSPDGLTLTDLIPLFIIIGIVAGAGIGAFGIYQQILIPRKKKIKKVVDKTMTQFEDVINIEYILVLYKNSGVALYFKSMGTERIDPDLVSGFISAVSSFGEKIDLQESLSEMKYGKKTLLLSDGEYIRAAVILGKEASETLRKNLNKFVKEFESKYADVLPDWRSNLKDFKEAGDLINKAFNTSIILPHITQYKLSDIKNLENKISSTILYTAESILEESERDFFFIGKLIHRIKEENEKEISDIFVGIKELQEKNIFIPIEFSEIKAELSEIENRNLLKKIFEQYS